MLSATLTKYTELKDNCKCGGQDASKVLQKYQEVRALYNTCARNWEKDNAAGKVNHSASLKDNISANDKISSSDTNQDIVIDANFEDSCIDPISTLPNYCQSQPTVEPSENTSHLETLVIDASNACKYQTIVKPIEDTDHLESFYVQKDSQTPYVDDSSVIIYQGKIKRPLNAFMIFAKGERNKHDKGKNQKEITKTIGNKWNLLSEEEKLAYKQEAKRLKQAHSIKYPNYKYQPKKKIKKKTIPISAQNSPISQNIDKQIREQEVSMLQNYSPPEGSEGVIIDTRLSNINEGQKEIVPSQGYIDSFELKSEDVDQELDKAKSEEIELELGEPKSEEIELRESNGTIIHGNESQGYIGLLELKARGQYCAWKW